MFQIAVGDLQNFLCHQILKRSSSTFVKKCIRHSSTRSLGCTRFLLKHHHKGDFTFKHIESFGFISTGLLTENSIKPLHLKRYKQTDSGGDPPRGSLGNHGDTSSTKTPSEPSSNINRKDASNGKTSKMIKMIKKKPFDYSNYTKNNLITPERALSEYLLEQEDLQNLPKSMLRSSYGSHQDGKMMTMFKKSDVLKKATEKHGSLENIEIKRKSMYLYSTYGYDSSPLFPNPMQQVRKDERYSDFFKNKSSKVVLCAIIINGFNMLLKLLAWQMTSSDSILAEAIHSGADTLNQVFLLYALWQSNKQADMEHPYGYKNIKHISSFGGGMVFFLVGGTICILEAWHACQNPALLTQSHIALSTMAVSFITESISLIYAWKEAHRSAKQKNMSWINYVRRGVDPNVSLVFLEDVASVLGVGIAISCMALAHYFQNSYIDALGSVLIGGILAYVSYIIVKSNFHALIGQSIPIQKQIQITQELEQDRVIRSLHDVKATQMAGDIMFKAEVDFDGREITAAYLNSIDTELLLEEMKNVKTSDDVVNIMLEHGDKIIGYTGIEIDRIEKKLKSKHPDLRHVDLEIL